MRAVSQFLRTSFAQVLWQFGPRIARQQFQVFLWRQILFLKRRGPPEFQEDVVSHDSVSVFRASSRMSAAKIIIFAFPMHNAPHYDVDLKLVFHSIRMESLHTVYRCCSYDPNRDGSVPHRTHSHTAFTACPESAAAQGYVAASITAFPKQVGRSFLDDDEYSSHDWRGRGADR